VLLRGEIDLEEATAELAGGFPTDLAAQARLVASGLEVGQGQEMEQDGFDEMPVLGAAGEEGAEGELVAFSLVKVDGGFDRVPGNPSPRSASPHPQ
jgi:hypothetical protein